MECCGGDFLGGNGTTSMEDPSAVAGAAPLVKWRRYPFPLITTCTGVDAGGRRCRGSRPSPGCIVGYRGAVGGLWGAVRRDSPVGGSCVVAAQDVSMLLSGDVRVWRKVCSRQRLTAQHPWMSFSSWGPLWDFRPPQLSGHIFRSRPKLCGAMLDDDVDLVSLPLLRASF